MDAHRDTSAERRLRRLAGVEAYALDDEMLLYAPDLGTAFSLSASARLVWELCDGSRTVAEIVDALGAIVDPGGRELARDVRDTLALLLDHALVEAVPSPGE